MRCRWTVLTWYVSDRAHGLITFSQRGAHPSHPTFPHSQWCHNMRPVPFKGSRET